MHTDLFKKFTNQVELDCEMCAHCINGFSDGFYPGCGDKITGHKRHSSTYCEILKRNISTSFNGVCDKFKLNVICSCGVEMQLSKVAYRYPKLTNSGVLMGSLFCPSCDSIKLINIRESLMHHAQSLYTTTNIE